MIDDAYGIGWKKADALALNMGLKHNSQFRIEAYVMHFLAARAEEGNSIIPANQTINSCIKELELTREIKRSSRGHFFICMMYVEHFGGAMTVRNLL